MNSYTYIDKDMKMKAPMIVRFKKMVLATALALLSMGGTASAQDEAVSVSPTYVLFPDTTTGEQSDAATITLTNSGYPSGMTVGTITLGGPHSADFNLSVDNCSAQVVVENTSCTLQANFVPRSSGIKSALVTIPYGDGDGNLSVYLTNEEGAAHEAQRRLSPVMYDINIPEELNATTSYDLNWTAMGYHSDYKMLLVMFDCTGIAAGLCGAGYGSSEKFHESVFLSPSLITPGSWSYNGEVTQNFQYIHPYTIPATRPIDGSPWPAEGTPIVIRLYVKSSEDITAGKSSLSLIIPGNLTNNYYDTSGRKIQKIICPSGGCTP